METTNKPTLRLVPSEKPTPAVLPELDTDLVDEASLAARLGVSRSTLQSWRYAKRGPRYIKLGRLIRYRNADIETYLRAQTSKQ
jgi:predicted DNA-binding transcriptional regulator AlpA